MEGRLGRLINKLRGPQDDWDRYERRMPGFKERMQRARAEFELGEGFVLLPDIQLIRVREYLARSKSPGEETVLVDRINTSADMATSESPGPGLK